MKYILLLIVLFGWGTGRVFAQNIEYGAELDTTYMMIGDQQHLRFLLKSDEAVSVRFPQLKDTVVGGVEIIAGPERDSVQGKDGKWLFRESYVITAFDTGVYVIPSYAITLENGDYNNVLRTEPLGFAVNTYKVDEQQGNYDIVAPLQTPLNFAEILPWLLWIAGGLAVVALIVWYIIRRKKNKPLFAAEKKVYVPPYVVAIKKLERLKEEKLWQAGKTKEYYTRLTDAVRQYVADELQIPAMEQTSFETVQALERNTLVDARDAEKIAGLLQEADFVKFAKSTPLPEENMKNLDIAYDFLQHTNERLKSSREEEKDGEAENTSETAASEL
ncbi:MAG: BatA domain-containing protein [Oscillibacter sp.]|nr:BatA domain-containing protein [Oscillibacter sp.]